eukprot:CAMPEP_0169110456 /NCGR_PEP_ID=MMETSP1015-20121227/26522_1 /TAXON_ID=342587 /ORGANISM="Karlodinium micrum, Strain CCMP2283" /LENGTH=166 /DNA_ID=CAMNT_0009172249 /DNA_START=62 /DNA_END=563 /DNA_ORIENTATION=+
MAKVPSLVFPWFEEESEGKMHYTHVIRQAGYKTPGSNAEESKYTMDLMSAGTYEFVHVNKHKSADGKWKNLRTATGTWKIDEAAAADAEEAKEKQGKIKNLEEKVQEAKEALKRLEEELDQEKREMQQMEDPDDVGLSWMGTRNGAPKGRSALGGVPLENENITCA